MGFGGGFGGGGYGGYGGGYGSGGYDGGYGYTPADYSTSDFATATAATASNGTVQYTYDVSTVTVTANHPTRDNNPGDIRTGTFAYNNGAIGNDGGFAIFPNPQSGYNAEKTLIESKPKSWTISQLINALSPSSDHNDTTQMVSEITSWSGLSSTQTLGSLTSAQMTSLVNAYGRAEGYTPH